MLLDRFEEVKVVYESETKKIILIYDQDTKQYAVKKVITGTADIKMYLQLRDNPHKNMVYVFDCMAEGNSVIVVEEWIHGVTLETLAEKSLMDDTQINSIMLQLFDAVEHLHQCTPPIVHRDIKPGNVMVMPDGTVKLMDFEIARNVKENQRRDTQIIGSIGFASPEQYGFKQSDQRSDIYALGVMLKYLTQHDLHAEVKKGPYHQLIETCLQLDPQRRYQTISELRDTFTMGTPSKNKAEKIWAFIHRSGIPGLKRGQLGRNAAVWIYYGSVIFLSVNVSSQEPVSLFYTIMLRMISAVMLLLLLWIPYNVGNIQHLLPLYRSKSQAVRFIGGAVIWSVIVILMFMILAILNSILKI